MERAARCVFFLHTQAEMLLCRVVFMVFASLHLPHSLSECICICIVHACMRHTHSGTNSWGKNVCFSRTRSKGMHLYQRSSEAIITVSACHRNFVVLTAPEFVPKKCRNSRGRGRPSHRQACSYENFPASTVPMS
jgi:hypothetical protein